MSDQILHAGNFSLIYQEGFLRRISINGNEILRMMYFALRDENWWTFPHIITNEQINSSPNHFEISYKCNQIKESKNVLQWNCSLRGDASGRIEFEIRGTVLEDTLKNRAGFCLLHPIRKLAGQSCTIEHPDGTSTASSFPFWVDPENPFKDISGMEWEEENFRFQLKFEGDVFETEDQRNWTDGSFKTFCTPLSIPFPVMIRKDQVIHQKITFIPSPLTKTKMAETRVLPVNEKNEMPVIGIAASTEADLLTDQAIQNLRALRLHHYRIDLDPSNQNWKTRLSLDALNAKLLDLDLEIALVLSDHFISEFDNVKEELLHLPVRVQQLLLLSQNKLVTDQSLINYSSVIRNILPQTKIGAGTDYNFTELNRNRFKDEPLDFISFAIQPQEHAFDNMSIMENTEAESDVVLSAKNIYPNKFIHISPITLRKRYNPYASKPEFKVLQADQRRDPRQSQEFCAEFLTAALTELRNAGTASVTLFQTVGGQGILSVDGIPFPVYDAIHKFSSR